MTHGPAAARTGADLGVDLISDGAARRAELRSYAELVRLLGPPVSQPARGDLAPVVLVPGFVSGDVSLTVLARRLRRTGRRTFGGRIGANLGCTDDMVARLERRVEAVVADEGRPVSLLGHSRGGMIVKLLAIRRPELVESLVVLSAPVTGTLQVAAHVRRQLELLFRLHDRGLTRVLGADCVTGACADRIATELSGPFPAAISYTSVYSQVDSIIDWRTCLDPAARCVEASASHTGMATDPFVANEVARALGGMLTSATSRAPNTG